MEQWNGMGIYVCLTQVDAMKTCLVLASIRHRPQVTWQTGWESGIKEMPVHNPQKSHNHTGRKIFVIFHSYIHNFSKHSKRRHRTRFLLNTPRAIDSSEQDEAVIKQICNRLNIYKPNVSRSFIFNDTDRFSIIWTTQPTVIRPLRYSVGWMPFL